MTLHKRLVENMKQAMKARDKLQVSVIRMVRSAIRDKELETFLPTQLSEAEIAALAEKVIKVFGTPSIRDMGKVMGKRIPEVRGKADNALISQGVRKQLS